MILKTTNVCSQEGFERLEGLSKNINMLII